MSLDTTLHGDPAGITAAAAGLGTLGQGFTSAASSVGAAGSLSESVWTGSAADAFRGGLPPVRRAIDEVAGATERANQAMQTFAGELKAVRAKIDQARSIASAAGLAVGADSIEPPKPPPIPRALTLTPAAATAAADKLAAAQAEYRTQLRAYRQAEQIMKEARAQEKEARATLGRVLAAVKTLLNDINDQKFWLAGGAGAEVLSRAVQAADRWAELSRLTEKYQWLKKWTEQPGWAATEAELAQRVERLQELRGRGPIPPGEAKGAQWLDTLLGDSKIRGLLRGAGVAAFGAQVITDILTKKGSARTKAVAADAASFGGGAVAGDAFLSAVTAGGVAGAPETLGASLVAAAAGVAIYEGIHHPGAIKDGAGWAWDHPWAVAGVPVIGPPVAIASGVVHGAGAIVHHAGAITDAAGDVLDAISPF
jgi:hypothetical protein